jgi:hypothetical protein
MIKSLKIVHENGEQIVGLYGTLVTMTDKINELISHIHLLEHYMYPRKEQATQANIEDVAYKSPEQLDNMGYRKSSLMTLEDVISNFMKTTQTNPGMVCYGDEADLAFAIRTYLKDVAEKAERCPTCHGVGSKLGFERDGESHEIKCPNCKGTGDDPQDTRENCHKCNGTGEIEKPEPRLMEECKCEDKNTDYHLKVCCTGKKPSVAP